MNVNVPLTFILVYSIENSYLNNTRKKREAWEY